MAACRAARRAPSMPRGNFLEFEARTGKSSHARASGFGTDFDDECHGRRGQGRILLVFGGEEVADERPPLSRCSRGSTGPRPRADVLREAAVGGGPGAAPGPATPAVGVEP